MAGTRVECPVKTAERSLSMCKTFVLSVFLLASALVGLSACADNKMPPNSPSGGIGSPTGPATGPAFQGVPG
jgi:hypothetical protein